MNYDPGLTVVFFSFCLFLCVMFLLAILMAVIDIREAVLEMRRRFK